MIRSELLQELHRDNPDLRADEIEQVVDIFFDEIAQRLAEGGRVELRGFGAFSTVTGRPAAVATRAPARRSTCLRSASPISRPARKSASA